MDLIDRFLQIVQESGITKKQFYESIGVSKSTFYGWVDNRGGVNLNNIISILKAYPNYNPRWILLGEGEKTISYSYSLPKQIDEMSDPEVEYGKNHLTRDDLSAILVKLADDIKKM